MTDIQQIVRDVISKKPDAELLTDLDATLAWAAQNKGSATAIGDHRVLPRRTQYLAVRRPQPELKAAVAWYGPVKGNHQRASSPRSSLDLADQIECPLLGLYGEKDTGIAVVDVEETAAKAKAAGKTVEIVVYPDAPHGFHADYRPSYRQADAEDGWKRMLAWFNRYGMAPAKS